MGLIRKVRVLIAALVVLALAAVGVQRLVAPKKHNPAWEQLHIGDSRDAVAIAVAPDGALFVASNTMNSGDVLRSTDHGRTWSAMNLRSQAVWNVEWLPRAAILCATMREGVQCLGDEGWGQAFSGVDSYFVTETSRGVIAGGHPSVMMGNAELTQFHELVAVSYAVRSAVEVEGRLLVAGSPMRVSDDGQPVRELASLREATVLAAEGSRVYAAGGTFGGFVQRSDDRGEHWRAVACPAKQPERLWVMPRHPDVVLMADHGDLREGDLWLSTNGGASWEALGCPGTEVHGMAVDETHIYCGATSMSGRAGLWRRPRAGLLPRDGASANR